jgi:hypothetical protein
VTGRFYEGDLGKDWDTFSGTPRVDSGTFYLPKDGASVDILYWPVLDEYLVDPITADTTQTFEFKIKINTGSFGGTATKFTAQTNATFPGVDIWSVDFKDGTLQLNPSGNIIITPAVADTEYHIRITYTKSGSSGLATAYLNEDGVWTEKTSTTVAANTIDKLYMQATQAVDYRVDDVYIDGWLGTITRPYTRGLVPVNNNIDDWNVDRYRWFRRLLLYSMIDTPREGQGLQRTGESEESLDQYSFLIKTVTRSDAFDVFNELRDHLINQPTSGYYVHYNFGAVETQFGAGEYEISFPINARLAGKGREVPA